MAFGAWSLLPPLIAIALAIASGRVLLPLAAGVLVGAGMLSYADPDHSLVYTPLAFFWAMWDSVVNADHAKVLAFSLLLGAMVGVLEAGGSMADLIGRLANRIRTRRGAQTLMAASGVIVFFDDYANTLLIGGTMRGVADRFGVSREKLAYIVDSTAAPIAGLALISSWTAIEVSYLDEGLKSAGVEQTGAAWSLFVRSIPYRFYCWLAPVLVFMIAISGRDFGPMRASEEAAATARSDADDETFEPVRARFPFWLAAAFPVLTCVGVVLAVLTVTGWRSSTINPDDSLLVAAGTVLGNGDPYWALILGGAAGWLTAIGLHLVSGASDGSAMLGGTLRGAWQMMPAMFVLWLAWALSAMTGEQQLDTGGYLAGVLSDRLAPVWLPTVVFLLAGGVAFSTGTSWGTMGILTPLAVALAIRLDPTGGAGGVICIATSGAVLAGAIFGDHCSPISDTTILSSRASGCDHVAHVRTQLPMALAGATASVLLGTLPAALGWSPWWCLIAGVVVLMVTVGALGKRTD